MDAIRLFMDLVDFSDDDGKGWAGIGELCHRIVDADEDDYDLETMSSLMLWILKSKYQDVKRNCSESTYRVMLYVLLKRITTDIDLKFILTLGPGKAVDIPIIRSKHPILSYLITSESNRLTTVLAQSPNLHYSVFDKRVSPRSESPTSLAMYNSWTFAHWRNNLVNQGINIEDFIDREMDPDEIDQGQRQKPLIETGWNRNALHGLFAWNFQLGFPPHYEKCHGDYLVYNCCDCPGKLTRHGAFVSIEKLQIMVQPHWQMVLNKIKQMKIPQSSKEFELEVNRYWNCNTSGITETHGTRAGTSAECSSINDIENVSSPQYGRFVAGDREEGAMNKYHKSDGFELNCPYDKNDMIGLDCWFVYEGAGARPNFQVDTESLVRMHYRAKYLLMVNSSFETDVSSTVDGLNEADVLSEADISSEVDLSSEIDVSSETYFSFEADFSSDIDESDED